MEACSILIPDRLAPEDILGLIGDMPMSVDAADLTVLPEKPGSMATMVLMLMQAAADAGGAGQPYFDT